MRVCCTVLQVFTAEVEGGAITSCGIILEHSSATPTALLNNLKDALTGKTALDCGCEGVDVVVWVVCWLCFLVWHCDHVHLHFQTLTHKHTYMQIHWSTGTLLWRSRVLAVFQQLQTSNSHERAVVSWLMSWILSFV